MPLTALGGVVAAPSPAPAEAPAKAPPALMPGESLSATSAQTGLVQIDNGEPDDDARMRAALAELDGADESEPPARKVPYEPDRPAKRPEPKPENDSLGEAAEVPEEPAKVDDPAKESASFRALRREKKKLEARWAELDRRTAEGRAQIDAKLSEIAAAQGRLARWERLEAAASEDPESVLEALGIRYEDLTTRRLRAGTPEEAQAALERRLERRIEERLKAEREAHEKEMRAAQEAHVAARAEAVHQRFLAITSDTQTYPELSYYEPAALVAAGNELAVELRGSTTLEGEAFLRHVATKLHERVAQQHARVRHAERQSATAQPEGRKKPAAVSPKTISNSAAASDSAPVRQIKTRRQEEQERYAEAIRAMDD